MTTEQLEKILRTYSITRSKYRDLDIEAQNFPYMLTTFRELIIEEVPPTQDKFIEVFLSKYSTIKKRGIISRLRRAYLSYIREYHLGFLLQEVFENVKYDIEADLAGIDYTLNFNNKIYFLHAYVDTEASRGWRETKNGRHRFVGEHIDLPFDLSRGKRVGKFLLYQKSTILSLRKSLSGLQ